MKPFRSLFQFIVYSNFYIAAIALLMALQTSWLFHGQLSYPWLCFIGSATICSYSFHYYLTDHSVISSPRIKWTFNFRPWLLLLFLLGLGAAAWFGWILRDYWPWLIPAVVATFLYSAPKVPHPVFRVLRKVAIGKTIFLAFIWMYVTAVLPVVAMDLEWNPLTKIYCIGQFFFIYAICILFDIRDREDDKADGVRSLITFLDTQQIKRLYYFSLGIYLAGLGVLLLKGMELRMVAFLLTPVSILFFIYRKANKDLSDGFYYFFLDGLMALSAMLMALTRI